MAECLSTAAHEPGEERSAQPAELPYRTAPGTANYRSSPFVRHPIALDSYPSVSFRLVGILRHLLTGAKTTKQATITTRPLLGYAQGVDGIGYPPQSSLD